MKKMKFDADGVEITTKIPNVVSILLFNSEEEHVISLQYNKKNKSHYIERDDQSYGIYEGVESMTLSPHEIQISLNPEGKKKLKYEIIIVNIEALKKEFHKLKKTLSIIFGKKLKISKDKPISEASKKEKKNTVDYSTIDTLYFSWKDDKKLPEYVSQMNALKKVDLKRNEKMDYESACMVLATLPTVEELAITPKKFPQNVVQLKRLKRLSITSMEGNQVIPDTFNQLKDLEELEIHSYGELKLPESLSQLTHLKKFSISAKRWNLPKGFEQWKNLTALSLSDCDIAKIPSEIVQLIGLQKFYLGNNPKLNYAEAFKLLGQIPSLQHLQFSAAEIPPQIGLMKQLTSLRIFGCGSKEKPMIVPAEIGNLSNLKTLELGGNYLPQLPEDIGKLTSLTTLNLYNAGLQSLPESLGQLKNLELLVVSENPELKKLPASLSRLKKLKIIKD